MKTFLKSLGAVALFVLLPWMALANYTFVQQDDGSFAIRNALTGVNVLQLFNDPSVGGNKDAIRILNVSGLELHRLSRWCGTTYLADISAESTAYVVSPVTGIMHSVDVTLRGAITSADSTVHFQIGSTSLSPIMTVANSGSGGGVNTQTVFGGAGTVSNGSVIHVGSAGESSTTAIADIRVCVDTW